MTNKTLEPDSHITDITLRFPKLVRWIKEQQVVRHFRGLFDAHKQPSAC